MMPSEPIRDIMHRTMTNLRFVEEHASKNGPFETTQLVNSFLGALAHPWEMLKPKLNEHSIADAVNSGWPQIDKDQASDEEPASLGRLITLMRHSIAHGNIKFLSNGRGEIDRLNIWNLHQTRKNRTWGATISCTDLRLFLDRFVELIEQIHQDSLHRVGQAA